jgi:hypothetical protein
MHLVTFFVVGPVLAIAIAFAAWRETENLKAERYRMVCVAVQF